MPSAPPPPPQSSEDEVLPAPAPAGEGGGAAEGEGADAAEKEALVGKGGAEEDEDEAPGLEELVRAHVVANGDVYVQRLADFAAIPSCSTVFERRGACADAAALVARWMAALGGSVESVNVGFQELPGGVKHDLPPVLLASIGAKVAEEDVAVAEVDPDKPTVLVYAHYDVREVAAMGETLPAVPESGVKFAHQGYRGVGGKTVVDDGVGGVEGKENGGVNGAGNGAGDIVQEKGVDGG